MSSQPYPHWQLVCQKSGSPLHSVISTLSSLQKSTSRPKAASAPYPRGGLISWTAQAAASRRERGPVRLGGVESSLRLSVMFFQWDHILLSQKPVTWMSTATLWLHDGINNSSYCVSDSMQRLGHLCTSCLPAAWSA